MTRPARVTLVEVGPRDGLQNEPVPVDLATRKRLVEMLIAAGHGVVEIGAFVSPKWVPQMAGSDLLLRDLGAPEGVRLPVLVPNLEGYRAAKAAGAREIAVFTAASESFSRRNTNCSIAESLARVAAVAEVAHVDGVRMRGYVSCVLGCPYEGTIDPAAVVAVAERLVELGCFEVSLGDTIGIGTADRARDLVEAVARRIGIGRVALHFHDTYGQALANILACLELGAATIDAAVAGLGGCPYAEGASGNVASEDVVYMLDGLGISSGVDLSMLAAAGRMIAAALGREPASRVARALAAKAP